MSDVDGEWTRIDEYPLSRALCIVAGCRQVVIFNILSAALRQAEGGVGEGGGEEGAYG